VKNTTDPQRKLELWSAYHKAHVLADVARDGAGSDPESQRRHAARLNAAQSTAGEVDEEKQFLYRHALQTGKQFSASDVDALISRKDVEHAMEMKYNVNFTNDGGMRADGSHVHWEEKELKAFDNTLRRMPDAHLAGNAGLTEIRRKEKVFWKDDPTTKPIGGIASGTQLLIPDMSADTNPSGEHRQLADPGIGSDISRMEWIMTHELGHNVSNKYAAAEAKYEAINGWSKYDQYERPDRCRESEARSRARHVLRPAERRAQERQDLPGRSRQHGILVSRGGVASWEG
jgi:hypothetical protein